MSSPRYPAPFGLGQDLPLHQLGECPARRHERDAVGVGHLVASGDRVAQQVSRQAVCGGVGAQPGQPLRPVRANALYVVGEDNGVVAGLDHGVARSLIERFSRFRGYGR